jgi:hypothetical protein
MNSIINEKKFIAERTGIPYSNLSQSYLRAETALGSNSQYSFQLQKGNTSTTPIVSERLLELNDEFVMTHVFIGLKKPASTSVADQLSAQVYTYPDIVTVANGGGGFTAVDESLYNGSFSLTINRKEFLPNFPIRFFRRVPDQQSGIGATGGTIAKNAFPNGLYGFAPFEPVKIDGRQTIDALIDLGGAVTFTTGIYAVLEVRGYLVVNAKS